MAASVEVSKVPNAFFSCLPILIAPRNLYLDWILETPKYPVLVRSDMCSCSPSTSRTSGSISRSAAAFVPDVAGADSDEEVNFAIASVAVGAAHTSTDKAGADADAAGADADVAEESQIY